MLFSLQLSSASGGSRARSVAIGVTVRAGIRDVNDLIDGRLCFVVVALLGQAAGNELVDVPRHW
jgi:hypothetical protein